MILNYEVGKLYDTITAIKLYFNSETMIKIFLDSNYKNPELYLEYFNEIEEKLDFIPDYLYPLFYYTEKKHPPIYNFFIYEINKENLSLEEMVKLIQDDNIFKNFIIKYIFDMDNILNNKTLVYQKITQMEAPLQYKFELQYLIYNYNDIKKELIIILKRVYSIISKLHIKYKKIINFNFKFIKKDDIKNIHKCDKSQINNGIVGFSLSNKYVSMFNNNHEIIQLILGISYIETITKNLNYNNPSYKEFFQICSNPIKFEILELLNTHKELNITELSKSIYITGSSICRYLDEMLLKSLIIISRTEANKIYYSINDEYFKLLKDPIDAFIDKMSKK